MDKNLRILIVDDSALVRSALREMLESDPTIRVVGEAANGRDALLRAQELKPDVITMDVRMPVMDGLETTEQLMAYNPTPVLAITALYSRDDVDISFKMLGSGALEVMEKPDISDPAAYARARRELVRRVKLLSRVKVVTHLRGRRRAEQGAKDLAEAERWRTRHARKTDTQAEPAAQASQATPNSSARSPGAQATPRKEAATQTRTTFPFPQQSAADDDDSPQPLRPRLARLRFPVVIIGASTGGPRVVQQILKGLPATFRAAVVVVQHIAEGFSAGMVEWLAETCALPVHLAAEQEKIAIGTILVAPDSFHLFVQEDGSVHLDDQTMLQRPSVDVTMQTAAGIFGLYTVGVLLTGMGRDGAMGMKCIRRVGGYTIAQDEASCSIYGMPRAAVEMNAVDEVLPPDGIVQALIRRFGSDQLSVIE